MELLKRIQELLLTKDVTAQFDKDNDLTFFARCGPMGARFYITVSKQSLVVRSHIPMFVPAARRTAMAEAISIANWQLRLARFEMDAADGELCCRADMPLCDGTPTDQQLTRIIYAVWNISEIYANAFLEVMTTQVQPALAIAKAERSEPESLPRTQAQDFTVN